jgi:glycosyltransferase involved in cell wall biosynthesis
VFRAFNTVELDFFAQGADISDKEKHDLRERLGIDTRHVVLYCGNLLELKGLGDLMPAFSEVLSQRDDVTLLLIGSGGDEAEYRAYCDAAGIGRRVVFAGFVDRTQLPPYYGIADLLVLPSRSEVWGLVINEAMACGVPVVTTDVVGAVPDLVQEGVNGYVVPARNPAALADAIQRFFQGGTDRMAMSKAARATIQPFTCARMADAFEAAVRCAQERA